MFRQVQSLVKIWQNVEWFTWSSVRTSTRMSTISHNIFIDAKNISNESCTFYVLCTCSVSLAVFRITRRLLVVAACVVRPVLLYLLKFGFTSWKFTGNKRERPLELWHYVYLSLWLYSPLDFDRFFSFLIVYTVGRTPWTGDQPDARPLPTHRITQTQNKRTQTSMPWMGFELNPSVRASLWPRGHWDW
jgi:hypothetical protein